MKKYKGKVYLTAVEYAEKQGVSKRAIYKKVTRGTLKPTYIDNQMYFEEEQPYINYMYIVTPAKKILYAMNSKRLIEQGKENKRLAKLNARKETKSEKNKKH